MPTEEPAVILTTKLHRPRIAPGTILRPRMLDLFEEASGSSVVLVSAPAGYGKTTAVDLWLDGNTSPYAWLSVDEHDSELRVFVTYLTAAVRTVYPESCQGLTSVLAGPATVGPALLADLVVSELEKLGGTLILVIDDYHLIRGLEVRSFMERLVAGLPYNLQLVLITRADPQLGLARLRGRGQLFELRGPAIRFTRDEATELLSQLIADDMEVEIADLLVERTEGWPLGLQLAGMALRTSQDRYAFAKRFAMSSHRSVADYLLYEVLGSLEDEQHRLLLRCAIVDRFCAPLCEELAAGTPLQVQVRDLIERAWLSNWFLVALDEDGTWYRFHHLFADFLRQRLSRVESEETIGQLHRQASSWFERNGLLEEAISHAVHAGDLDRAATLVEQNIDLPLNREEWRALERWLGLLPEELLRRPGLLVVQAFLAWFGNNQRGIDACLDTAEEGLLSKRINYTPQQTTKIQAHIHQLRANVFSRRDPSERLAHAERALELLAPGASFCRGQSDLFCANALHHLGRTEEALAYLSNRIESQQAGSDARILRMMLGVLNIHYAQADIASIDSVGDAALQVAENADNKLSLGWIVWILGWAQYQRNNLVMAVQRFGQGVNHRYEIALRPVADCYSGLAFAQLARGQFEDAALTADGLRNYVTEMRQLNMLPLADALDLHVLLARDQHSGAESRLRSVAGLSEYPEVQLAADSLIIPALTSVRAHLAHSGHESMGAAWDLLQRCRDFAARTNLRRRLIEIGTLEARYHSSQGDAKSALGALRASVRLAEPGGALRLIADNVIGLDQYVQQLQEEGLAPSYLAQVCEVLAQQERTKLESTGTAIVQMPNSWTSVSSDLAVPDLTVRESEVLRLLARGLSNKEVAAELTVSANTVKMHTSNIYQKLNVPNRRSAVRIAVKLGLVPPNG